MADPVVLHGLSAVESEDAAPTAFSPLVVRLAGLSAMESDDAPRTPFPPFAVTFAGLSFVGFEIFPTPPAATGRAGGFAYGPSFGGQTIASNFGG